MNHNDIHVFVNRTRVNLDSHKIIAGELLNLAGFAADQYELYALHGEHDHTGGDAVPNEHQITVKNGDHFRAIPKDRNFGSRP